MKIKFRIEVSMEAKGRGRGRGIGRGRGVAHLKEIQHQLPKPPKAYIEEKALLGSVPGIRCNWEGLSYSDHKNLVVNYGNMFW